MKTYIGIITFGACLMGGLSSCNDFLDREPLDQVTPEAYFTSEADLSAYTINAYPFPTTDGYLSSSPLLKDNDTDNQAGTSNNSFWMPGQKKVPANAGDWSWTKVRACNYFFDNVLPKYEAGEIQGNSENIKHYIGEMYVIRAYNYYQLLVSLGDLPIVTTALPDIKEDLMEASKRQPRHKVAEFILKDLQTAIDTYLLETPPGGKTRISRDVALLLRARVALFEGTWEKYHAGTAFVPNGNGWPGDKELAADYNPTESIKYFLGEAMKSAKELGDKMYTKLTENTEAPEGMNAGFVSQNPYYTMFCDENMESYDEVIMWRQFKEGLVSHSAQMELCRNGGGSGWTKGMVDSYVMKNGYPIYDIRSGYKDDWENEGVNKTLEGRDSRIVIFTKKPGDVDFYQENGEPSLCAIDYIFGSPASITATTGFIVKKGKHYSSIMASVESRSTSGTVVFRGAEALLAYMEASYEYYSQTGSPRIDETADKYWRALRRRAGVEEDYNITIGATQMTKEAKGDFGAYSHGQLIDATLYNIRRERRNELCAENTRWEDLKRWRACDQLIGQPYRIQGMKFWNTVYSEDADLMSKCVVDPATGNMSNQSLGDYIVPYEKITKNNTIADQGGYLFTPAHYLNPIGMAAFRETAVVDGDFSSSVIYQNPGWKIQADSGPEVVE